MSERQQGNPSHAGPPSSYAATLKYDQRSSRGWRRRPPHLHRHVFNVVYRLTTSQGSKLMTEHDELKKLRKNSASADQRFWRIVVFVVSITLFAIIIDFKYSASFAALQRSGSILVCIGIMSWLESIKTAHEEYLSKQVEKYERSRDSNDSLIPRKFWPNLELASIPGSTDYVIDSYTRYFGRKARAAKILCLSLLLFGTFLSGFGDLISKYLVSLPLL